MMITEIETAHTHHSVKRICWTAIFVGALVGVGLSFLLNLFGVAIGLTAFNTSKDGVIGLAMGGMLGTAIGIIAAMLVAGYAAGYLGRYHSPKRNLGILYGFTTWSVALLISAIVATHVSAYITSYSKVISHSIFVVPNENATPTVTTTKSTTMSSGETNAKNMKVAVSPNDLALGVFGIFILFFLGALASCVGACCGMSCKRKD